MRIPDEIIRQLHEINCEDAAKRFGLDVKNHMAHCFKHNDRIASLGFRNNHWKCFSCDIYNPQNHPSTFLKRSVSILRFFSKTKRLF